MSLLVKGRLIIKHDISVREEESDRLYLLHLTELGQVVLVHVVLQQCLLR